MNEVRADIAHPGSGFAGPRKAFISEARALNTTATPTSLPFTEQPFEPFAFVASHDRNPRLASDLEEMKRHGMPYSVDEGLSVHEAWYPQYRGADLIFWSDGQARTWKDVSADGQRIGDSVFVPAIGLVVIRRRS